MTRLGLTFTTLTVAALLVPVAAFAQRRPFGPPPKAATKPAPVQAPVQQPAAAPDEAKVVVIDEAQAREWELQIELELMADPVTFPHALKCLAGQNGMEVRGYVPNPLVRDRALSTARKASPMEVANGLVIQSNMLYGAPGTLTLEAVQARLAKLNTSGLSVVEVQLGLNGQVVLSGRTGSQEERVSYSRCLRGLAGCSCVKNEMAAPPGMVVVPVITASVPPAAVPLTPPTVIQAQPQTGAPPTRGTRVSAPWSPAPPATTSAFTPGRLGASAADGKAVMVDHGNPLMPPTRSLAYSAKPPVEVAHMPPPPVAPYRPADARSDATVPAVAREEKTDKVVQATQNGPATPGVQPKSQPAGPEAKTTVATLSARNQQALKQRLRAALGAAVRDLDMMFDGKGGVKVIVMASGKSQELDKVAVMIVQAPELRDFDVSLELRLDP